MGAGPIWVQFEWLVDVNPADACAQRIGVSFRDECSYVGTGTRSRGVCACYRRSNKTCSNEYWCRRDSSQSGNPHGPHLCLRPRMADDALQNTGIRVVTEALRPTYSTTALAKTPRPSGTVEVAARGETIVVQTWLLAFIQVPPNSPRRPRRQSFAGSLPTLPRGLANLIGVVADGPHYRDSARLAVLLAPHPAAAYHPRAIESVWN